jgi:hypothetical protein
MPGIRADDRTAVDRNAGGPPAPPLGPVRGTMSKPQLPRRRAQEHIAPQLRDGPTPPVRQDADRHIGHDPGLMAAFQRGIGRADAEQTPEPGRSEADTPTGSDGSGHTDVPSDATLAGDGPASAPAPGAPAADPADTAEPRPPHVPDHDPTARHDGTTPAG